MEIRIRDVMANIKYKGATIAQADNIDGCKNDRPYRMGSKGCSDFCCDECRDKTMTYMETYQERPERDWDDNDDDQDPCYQCDEDCEGCQYND